MKSVTMAVGLLLAIPSHAVADEPSGCEAFKWPLLTEAAVLRATDKPVITPDHPGKPDGKAYELKLVPLESAHLLFPPQHAPKISPSTAGIARFEAPAAAGSVQVTISAPAWVDVVQNGHIVRSSAFTGAQGCPGVRKSIRFDLAASPFTIQISDTRDNSIGIVAGSPPP